MAKGGANVHSLGWKEVKSGVQKGSVLFKVFLIDLKMKVHSEISKFDR